jgi:hypothetical protein
MVSAVVLAPLCLLLAAACSGDDDAVDPTEPGQTASDTETGESPSPAETDADPNAIKADDVEGHWRSNEWGDLYLETGADGITRGVYPHDLGTVQGVLEDGTFVGWWCEAPSREPPGDAGAVEFRFTRAADGSLSLDGRWKYGADEPDWRENWDLALVDEPIDEATLARLENDDEFCDQP